MGRLVTGIIVESRPVELPPDIFRGEKSCELDPEDCCDPSEVDCCPDLPDTLYATFRDQTGACTCLTSITLTWDNIDMVWLGTTTSCGGSYSLMLECDDGEWVLTDTAGNSWVLDTTTEDNCVCLVFTESAMTSPCSGSASVVIATESGIDECVMQECSGSLPPETLYAHFQGSASFFGTVTLNWNGFAWVGDSDACGGGVTVTFKFRRVAPLASNSYRMEATMSHTGTTTVGVANSVTTCVPFLWGSLAPATGSPCGQNMSSVQVDTVAP
jgi:hypothetical protein